MSMSGVRLPDCADQHRGESYPYRVLPPLRQFCMALSQSSHCVLWQDVCPGTHKPFCSQAQFFVLLTIYWSSFFSGFMLPLESLYFLLP